MSTASQPDPKTDPAGGAPVPCATTLEFLRGDGRSDFLKPADADDEPRRLLRFEHRRAPGVATAAPSLLEPSDGDVVDTWFAHGSAASAMQTGCLSYCTDGDWMAGTAIVDDRTHLGGLEGAALQAYGELFALLARHRTEDRPFHLLRLWNYMADINGADDGQERYRRFNVGRQRAFQQARHSAFEGAPAACALGTEQGPFTMHFLAGPVAPTAVENPRQVSAYRYPTEYGPSSPTFSRAATVMLDHRRQALLISGTASIVGHASQHAEDVVAQVEETLRNIDALLQRAAPSGDAGSQALHRRDHLDCTVYVKRPTDLPRIRATFERIVGPDSPSARRAIYLRADICRADLLVEIEAQSIATLPEPHRYPIHVERIP